MHAYERVVSPSGDRITGEALILSDGGLRGAGGGAVRGSSGHGWRG